METGQASRSLGTDNGNSDSHERLPPRLVFQLTQTDYLRACRFHRNRFQRRWLGILLMFVIYSLIGAAGIVYGLARQPYATVNPMWYVLQSGILTAALCWVIILTFWPYLSIPTRRRIHRDVERFSESTIDLDEDGFRLVTAASSTVIRWDGFRGHAESKHGFLLYTGDSQFWVIPKEALTPAVCEQIRALFKRKVRQR